MTGVVAADGSLNVTIVGGSIGSTVTTIFNTVAAAIATTVDASIKTIQTAGYTAVNQGSAVYHRMLVAPTGVLLTGNAGGGATNRGVIRTTDRFTSAGATDATNGGYWMLDPEQGIKVTMFGALGDDAADDTIAIKDAHDYCNKKAKLLVYIPLIFPVYNYVATSAIRFVEGMRWIGEGDYTEEFSNRTKIKNSSSHIFDMVQTGTSSQRTVKDIIITGIKFDGGGYANGFNLIAPQSLSATEGILNYTTIAWCGIINFATGIQLTGTGIRINNNYFNNCNQAMYIAGSDHMIRDNEIGGNTVADGLASTADCRFGSFEVSRFSGNFITGRPQMPIRCDGSLTGSIFSENWLDICDWTALDLNNAHGGTFDRNTFHQAMLGKNGTTATTSGTYNSIVRFHNAYDNALTNNIFFFDDNHTACLCVSTSNITLSGEQTIDGVLTSASRVLVAGQTTGANNGIYVSAAGAWSRASDMDVASEVGGTDGRNGYFPVTSGLTYANTFWMVDTAPTITLGSTSLSFIQDTRPTYGFDGATTKSNTLIGNRYTSGYQRIISIDTSAEYPYVYAEDKFPTASYRWRAFTDLEFNFSTSGDGEWFQNLGTNATLNAATPWASNVVGAVAFASSTTASTNAAIRTGTSTMYFSGGQTKFNARLKIRTLSTGTDTWTGRIGWINTSTGDATNGAYFRYTDGVNSGKFEAVTVNNSVATATDTTVAPVADTEYRLKIISNKDGSSVAFYINDSLVATNTTNIPNTSSRVFGPGASMTRTAGTAAVTSFDLDYLEAEMLFNTPRG